MNEQKENDLMLNIPPIIKHQIEAEDDIAFTVQVGVAATSTNPQSPFVRI